MDHVHDDATNERLIEIPSLGFVRTLSVCADDLSVVNSARVSFGKRKTTMEEADEGLISFLLRERHGTPFEHNFFSFHIKAPIFVVREWFRHRIGWSYNEMSGRYTELPFSAYTPLPENVRSQVGKPGQYKFESLSQIVSEESSYIIADSYARAYSDYKDLLELGVAKELARSVLPVGVHTEFYASTNARALMHFLSLRGDETAQWEIRQYANALGETLAKAMPVTYDAFIANGAIAP